MSNTTKAQPVLSNLPAAPQPKYPIRTLIQHTGNNSRNIDEVCSRAICLCNGLHFKFHVSNHSNKGLKWYHKIGFCSLVSKGKNQNEVGAKMNSVK